MKFAVVSLVMLLPVFRGCESTADDLHHANRETEVAQIIAGQWDIGDRYSFDVEGPLQIDAVDKKLRAAFEEERPEAEERRREFVKKNPQRAKELPVIRVYEDCQQGKSWHQLRTDCREGDELYSFTSEEGSWGGHGGVRGYALIRGREVAHITVTLYSDGVWRRQAKQPEPVQPSWCIADTSDPVKRKADIVQMMADRWKIADGNSLDIEGPLDIVEVEKQMRTAFQERLPRAEKLRIAHLKRFPFIAEQFPPISKYEECHQGRAWERLKAEYREGDELHLFTSEGGFPAWCHGTGRYVLIRGSEVVYVILKTDGVQYPERFDVFQIGGMGRIPDASQMERLYETGVVPF